MKKKLVPDLLADAKKKEMLRATIIRECYECVAEDNASEKCAEFGLKLAAAFDALGTKEDVEVYVVIVALDALLNSAVRRLMEKMNELPGKGSKLVQ